MLLSLLKGIMPRIPTIGAVALLPRRSLVVLPSYLQVRLPFRAAENLHFWNDPRYPKLHSSLTIRLQQDHSSLSGH